MKNDLGSLKAVLLVLVIVTALAILLTRQARKESVGHTWVPVHGVLVLEEGYIFEATPYVKLQICTKHEGEIRAVMIPVKDVPWPHGIDYEQFKLFMGGKDEQGSGREEISRSKDESAESGDNPD